MRIDNHLRTVAFHGGGSRSVDTLRIETEGCAVYIKVGLRDAKRRDVISIQIVPHGLSSELGWILDGYSVNRVIRLDGIGEKK